MSACPPKRAEGQRELYVIDAYPLTTNMHRVILGGDELADLVVDGSIIGPHLKMIIPPAGGGCLAWPEFDAEKGRLVWPENVERPTLRTYSLRHFDVDLQQLTIDLVSHEGGVASSWARNAKPGDKLGIWGPGGRMSFNGQWLVLVGDISALPAISYSLEMLPDDAQGKAIIEVPSESDCIDLKSPAGIEIIWLVQHQGQPSQLVETVTSIDIPAGVSPLVWGGMECDLAKALRRGIKEKLSLSRDRFYLINYWRAGIPEGGFNHSDEE